MRRFLQSPAEQHADPQDMCVQFALEEISAIELLVPSLSQIITDFHLRYSLEYHLGVYALYAAQIKWYIPGVIKDACHLDMRDHYMHGNEHSYAVHVTTQVEDQIKKDIEYLFKIIKPSLLHHLTTK